MALERVANTLCNWDPSACLCEHTDDPRLCLLAQRRGSIGRRPWNQRSERGVNQDVNASDETAIVAQIPVERAKTVLDFDAFYRAQYAKTVRLARLLTGSAAAAEDLAQEAFIRVHRNAARIDNPGGFLRTRARQASEGTLAMTTELDTRLRELFTELADGTPVEAPSRFRPEELAAIRGADDPAPRSRWVIVAGLAAATLLLVGLVVIGRGDHDKVLGPSGPSTTTRQIPATDPVLWLPDTSSGSVHATEHQQADAAIAYGAAVVSPDGTVFGINVNLDYGNATRVGTDERIVGGFTVKAFVDGSSPGEIYRSITAECINVGINSAGEDKWSNDAINLIDSLTMNGTSIQFNLPTGWSTLGHSASRPQFETTFDVEVNGASQTLSMWQMPNAPVGFYLTAEESNPKAIQVGGMTAWISEGVTTPGYTTLVAERDGTAFSISGRVPTDQLIAIAREMVRAPQTEWTAPVDPNVTRITPAPAPAGCQLPGFDIVPNPAS